MIEPAEVDWPQCLAESSFPSMPTIGVALPIGDKRKTAPSEAILPKHSRSCAFTKLVSDSEAGESGQCRGVAKCVVQVFVPDGPCPSRRE